MTRPLRLAFLVLALGLASARAAEQKADLGAPFAVAPGVEGGLPQYRPELAWSPGARVWLVVWEDGHAASGETAREGRCQDIYAARVSADGRILDPKGIPVCTARDFQGWPCVASDGKDFLVAWHDMRGGKDWDVYAARVSSEGKVLDADGFLLAGGARSQCLPDLVFGGGSYYAAWLGAQHFPECRVYGGRVSPAGRPLDGEGTELMRFMTDREMDLWRKAPFAPGKGGSGWHDFGRRSGHSRQPCRPTLATNGKTHVACTYMSGYGANGSWSWQEYRLRSVDASSGRPSGEMLPLKTNDSVKSAQFGYGWGNLKNRLGLAGTGEKGFLVAGFHNKHGFGSDGSGIRVAFFLDATGKPVTEEVKSGKDSKATLPKVRLLVEETAQKGVGYRTGGVRSNTLALAWDGKRALHVSDRYMQMKSGKSARYTGDLDVVGIFLDAEGRRLDLPGGKPVEPDKRHYERKGKNLSADPPRLTPFLVASGEAVQGAPAAAAGEEGSFLVVWQEQPAEGPSRIMARLVRAR